MMRVGTFDKAFVFRTAASVEPLSAKTASTQAEIQMPNFEKPLVPLKIEPNSLNQRTHNI